MHGILILALFYKYCTALNESVWIATHSVDLKCNGGGSYYIWKKIDENTYRQINNSEKYSNVDTYHLRIYNIECSDAGRYVCESNIGQEETIHLGVTTFDGWRCWSKWSSCSVNCGIGVQTRTRICPRTYSLCDGSNREYLNCSTPCDVNGSWSDWVSWSDCSVTCGNGRRERLRRCNNPPPKGTGSDCVGSGVRTKPCSKTGCGVWTAWSGLIDCPTSCGEGYYARSRECIYQGSAVANCKGDSAETKLCTVSPCIVDVASDLSITCNNTVQITWYKNGRRLGTGQQNLNITNAQYNDAGTYYCMSSLGYIGNKIAVTVQDSKKSSFALGAFGVVIVIIALVIFILLNRKKRRRRHNENDNRYETTNMSTELATCAYDISKPSNIYYNQCLEDLEHSSGLSFNCTTIADILKTYSAKDFAKTLWDASSLTERIKKEFQAVVSDKCLAAENNDEATESYFDIDGSSVEIMSTNSLVKRAEDGAISIITVVPSKENIQQFWSMIDKFNVTKIVLLTKTKEQIYDFYPTTNEPIITPIHALVMTSAEWLEEEIFKFTLKLCNMVTQSEVHVDIYKITSWEVNRTHPTIASLSKSLNIITETQSRFTCFIGSKENGLPICGCLSVCFDVVNAIKNDTSFNIVRLASEIKNRLNIFRTIEEYELCYALIEKYMENTNIYDTVE